MEIVVVHSEDPSTPEALEDLLGQARAQVGERPARAALLLAGIDHDHQAAVDAIVDAFPGIALIGCTTDGEMSSAGGFCEDSLVLTLFVGEIEVAAGLGRNAGADPQGAAWAALGAARAGLRSPPRLCVTTPESLTCDAVVLLDRLRAGLGDVPVIGGTAADSWRFKRCLQFCGREVVSDSVPVLLFAGSLKLSIGIASGWAPIGEPSVVEAVEGNIVARIGGATATDFYQQRLGPHHVPSGEYPLAVFDGETSYLRAPVTYDLAHGTITFAGSVPAGARVQLTSATRDDIVAATTRAVADATANYPGEHPTGALLVSCAARKQLLGTRVAEEQALVRGAMGDLPFAGFYAYGEFGPLRAGDACYFHNETFVAVVLGDR